MPRSLADMVVVITGASSGIGAALARQLGTARAQLALAARRENRLVQLAADIVAAGGPPPLLLPTDLAGIRSCPDLIDRVFSHFGRLDTLVCNAGYGQMSPLVEMTPEQSIEMFTVNVLGTTECVRAALPRMLAQPPRDGFRGQVMMVSSAAARRGLPNFGMYSATKAAQLSLSEALRVELRGRGVAVTSVHPVGTTTEFFHVAEARGSQKLGNRAPGDVTQSADTVALAMLRAIRKPRREVWPFPPSRYMLSLVTLWPWLGDTILSRTRMARK
jgi:short-subunit dehydrogenase